MLALTILLFMALVTLIMIVALLVASGLQSLLGLVIPVVPLLMTIGSFLLGSVELILLLGSPDDRRLAKRDLSYLGGTFVVSGGLWWLSTHFLWHL